MSLQELEQDPFDPEEFVERLAWRTMGTKARSNPDEFYPMTLHGAFEKTIRDLKDMNARMQKNVEKLESECQEEEKRHWQRVAELQKTNQQSYAHFQELNERINFVATKVVHLGDQLEGVNNPRARAVEAQRLMNYFSEFLSDEPLKSAVFTDPFQLQLAADIIQKLHLVAMELPKGEKFVKARNRINVKYEHIEKELIEEFRIAHQAGERKQMKRVASVLSHFKGYGQCINAFIEECQKGAYKREDLYADIVPLCQTTYQLINEVFTSPETVMSKFIQNIYLVKLKNNINEQLQNTTDSEKYLQKLFKYYTKTTKLSNELSTFKLGNDSSFLNKQTKAIFDSYLDTYISLETRYLKERGVTILQRYYHGKDHEKKQFQSGGIHDLRRDLQAKIGTISNKANINIGPAIENYGGETFLSQEVAISVLQETKEAFKRCKVLSGPSDLPKNAVRIFEVLVQFLITEHIDYAVELGLQAVPLAEPKSEPQVYYFDVVGQANTIFHLFEKQFSDSLVPLVLSSPQHSECVTRKRELIEQLENKMDLGLDRSVSAIIGWIRFILATEQKKTDFKNDAEDAPLSMLSPACEKVTKFLSRQVRKIRDGLDGKNVEATLMELGTRFHRLIFEHFQQFQYNSIGAMLVICDVNEYRKCVKDFQLPLITQLFEKLHALCNLLVVVPENLKQVCTGDPLTGLEKQVLLSFVQLRADYKTARIANILK